MSLLMLSWQILIGIAYIYKSSVGSPVIYRKPKTKKFETYCANELGRYFQRGESKKEIPLQVEEYNMYKSFLF